MKSSLQSWTSLHWTSLSEKADGLGSKNKEKDSAPQQLSTKTTNQKPLVSSLIHITHWSKDLFWLHLWVCHLTFHKLHLHLKNTTFKRCQIAFTKESINLTICKKRTTTLSTDSSVWFTDCDLFEIKLIHFLYWWKFLYWIWRKILFEKKERTMQITLFEFIVSVT